MIPFLVLIVLTLILAAIGAADVSLFRSWEACLRGGFAGMFLLTASAHWGRRRRDLIRMVPQGFPRPDLIVTITGVLEVLGAIGLVIPATSKMAALCLAMMLVAVFPANVRAARHQMTIAGDPVPGLGLRTMMQVVFIGGLLAVALVSF